MNLSKTIDAGIIKSGEIKNRTFVDSNHEKHDITCITLNITNREFLANLVDFINTYADEVIKNRK